MQRVYVLLFVALFTMLCFAGASVAYAQSSSEDLTEEEREREQALEKELEKVLAEIREQKKDLASQRSRSASIERDISILEAEIREAELELQANRLRVQELTGNISATEERIEDLERQTEIQKSSLGQLVRDMRKQGDHSIVEILLSHENLSDFFRSSDSIVAMRMRVESKLEEVRDSQKLAEEKKESLQELKSEELSIQHAISQEKSKIEVAQNERAELLAASRNKEQTYEEIISQREARASAIRSALFDLRDATTEINFGQALDLAREVEQYTGVRPAFLLAVLTQETRIGQHIGSCNLSSTPDRMWKDIMKPSRDHAPYLRITESLGISPEDRPLSCPQSVGWGGAMGPSQFIPSTWEMYASRVASAVGVDIADPWKPRDAFFASGIYLADLGAGAGTYQAELEAAGRYYAGGNWQTAGMNYANSVLQIANNIQTTQIDPLESF